MKSQLILLLILSLVLYTSSYVALSSSLSSSSSSITSLLSYRNNNKLYNNNVINAGELLIENEAQKEVELALSATDTVKSFFMHRTKHSSSNSNSNNVIVSQRNNGNNKLLSYKLPYGKDEPWRFTNLKKYFFQINKSNDDNDSSNSNSLPLLDSILEYVDDNCIKSFITFIDGNYISSLSDTSNIANDMTIKSLKSLDNNNDKVNDMLNYIPDAIELPRNSFGSDILTVLNMANLEDGLLLSVPDNKKVDPTLQVIFWNSKGKSTSYPRLLVDVNEGAELKLKQSYISDSGITEEMPSFIGGNTRILVKKGGKLTHTYVQELSESTRHSEVISAHVDGDSNYDVSIVQVGSNIGRVNIHIDLKGEGANCTLSGITLSNTKQSLDMHSSILHDSPSATSRQQQRNVIGDRGEAIFKGRIRIPKHAQLTDSDQLCRTIMLGERARVIAMPTLEITADNVVCSHGASVQELDENELFYLASRGINKKEAKRLLLRSFCLELLDNFDMDKKGEKRLIDKIDKMFIDSSISSN